MGCMYVEKIKQSTSSLLLTARKRDTILFKVIEQSQKAVWQMEENDSIMKSIEKPSQVTIEYGWPKSYYFLAEFDLI